MKPVKPVKPVKPSKPVKYRQEFTSEQVASIAGRLLSASKRLGPLGLFVDGDVFTGKELASVAGSALTQVKSQIK